MKFEINNDRDETALLGFSWDSFLSVVRDLFNRHLAASNRWNSPAGN